MNCVIPGANMKVISKAVQALSKIGDDIYLKPKKDHLSLESVNMTTTAYCNFKFYEVFFSSYEVCDTESESLGEALLCKITAKAILGVFKSHGYKDNKPEFCKIELEPSSATKIIFRFKYKHDIAVVKSLYLSDGKLLSIVYDKDLATNRISTPAQLFTKVLSNFQASDNDISFDFSYSKALVRNYITGDVASLRSIRSQINLMAVEFNSFKIDRQSNITFSLKPFRAAIHFAESFNLVVVLSFEATGKPAILVIKSPTFEGNFVLATLKAEDDTQSTLPSTIMKGARKSCSKKNGNALNITVQDQEALKSINWNNDFEDVESNTKKKTKFDDIIAQLNDERSKSVNNNVVNEQDDVISNSPESLTGKRIRSIFGRCYDNTFNPTSMDLGEILAPDSDPDSS